MERGLIIGFCWTLLGSTLVNGEFQLQNVACESFDLSMSEFTRCEMKVVRRGVSAFYMVLKLKVPINNVDVNVSLFKKSNGYLPYLFNQTFDFCYYMRNPQAHPLIYMLHRVILPVSNMNHSCPYNVSISNHLSENIKKEKCFLYYKYIYIYLP